MKCIYLGLSLCLSAFAFMHAPANAQNSGSLQHLSFGADIQSAQDPSVYLQYRLVEEKKLSPYLGIGLNYAPDYVDTNAADARDQGIESTLGAAIKIGMAYKF